MEIKLQNFGKIKNAEVKLDGLTLIAGRNDTGKSTVGKALFSIISSIKEYPSEFERIKRERFFFEHFLKLNQVFQRESEDEKLKKEIKNLIFPNFSQDVIKVKSTLDQMRVANVKNIEKDIREAIRFLSKTENENEKIYEISRRSFGGTFFINLNNSVHENDKAELFYKHKKNNIISYSVEKNNLKVEQFLKENKEMSFNDVVFIDNPYVLEEWKKIIFFYLLLV